MSWIRNTTYKVPDLIATLVLGMKITREADAPQPLKRWRRSRSGCSATSPPSAGPPPPFWAPPPPPAKTSISIGLATAPLRHHQLVHRLLAGHLPHLLPKPAFHVVLRIRNPDPGWTTRIIVPRAKKLFFGLKYLNSFMWIRDPGWKKFGNEIRDGKNSDPG